MYLPKVNLQQIQQFKEKYLNRNIVSYLICVVIASILWFLNTLSKDYLTEISGQVHQFPRGKISRCRTPHPNPAHGKSQRICFIGT